MLRCWMLIATPYAQEYSDSRASYSQSEMTMSEEADYGISEWVWQAGGTERSWELTWQRVIDHDRFVGVSFQSDFAQAKLERLSEWFANDNRQSPRVGELIRATTGIGGGVAFRFSVVVIPSH
jgi:hypothetical protein